MKGAIIGDIVGSIYEHHNIFTKDFELFGEGCTFTDDTVLSCAIAKAMCDYTETNDKSMFEKNCFENMRYYGLRHISAGYGGTFFKYLLSPNPRPYNSYGNGSAMRVSSIGLLASTLDEAGELAEISARITHNHPEGIMGAKAMAEAIWLLNNKFDKEKVKDYIEEKYYSLNINFDELRSKRELDVTCQVTVPISIKAFLDSNSFEDTIRTAISLGGDSDTIGSMAGALAEAHYGVPEDIDIRKYLKDDLLEIVDRFYKTLNKKKLENNNVRTK